MSDVWYFQVAGTPGWCGPFSGRQLKELAALGRLRQTDFVRSGDQGKPVSASQVQRLFETDTRDRPTAPPPRLPKAEVAPPSLRPTVRSRLAATLRRFLSKAAFPFALVGLAFLAAATGWLLFQWDNADKVSKAITSGNELWDNGEHDKAVAEYEAVVRLLPPSDVTTVVYHRMVEHALRKSDRDAAESLLKAALDRRIRLDLQNPEAADMLAEVKRARSQSVAVGPTSPATAPMPSGETSIAAKTADTPVPDFSDVDYTYDYSKDDYTTIPDKATRQTIHGQKSGKWFDKDGYVTESGEFVAHGAFTLYHDEQRTRKYTSGMNLHGKMHGIKYEYRDDDGTIEAEMPYVHDKKHGIMKIRYKSGQLKDETPYLNDEFHGYVRSWYENGQLELEVPWVHGKLHGLARGFFADGKPSHERSWRDGVLHGPWRMWDEGDGFNVDGQYEDGKMAGRWKGHFRPRRGGEMYDVEVTGPWQGGTRSQFIFLLWLIGERSTAWPKDGIASVVVSRQRFLAVFGEPDRVSTARKEDQRLCVNWSYICSDTVVSFDVLRDPPTIWVKIGNL